MNREQFLKDARAAGHQVKEGKFCPFIVTEFWQYRFYPDCIEMFDPDTNRVEKSFTYQELDTWDYFETSEFE